MPYVISQLIFTGGRGIAQGGGKKLPNVSQKKIEKMLVQNFTKTATLPASP